MTTILRCLRVPSFVLLAAAGAFSLVAQAADGPQRKPGLWEVESTVHGNGLPDASAQMQESMAKMSPQQRAMVEEMMKKHGVAMGGPGHPHSFRYCLSPEQAAREAVPQAQPDADTHCTRQLDKTSATEAKFSFSCQRKDGSTVKGEGRAYDLSPESYAMSLHMTMQRNGQPMELQTEQKGHWVGANCQGLKPLGQ
jgi:hypothetical protein